MLGISSSIGSEQSSAAENISPLPGILQSISNIHCEAHCSLASLTCAAVAGGQQLARDMVQSEW